MPCSATIKRRSFSDCVAGCGLFAGLLETVVLGVYLLDVSVVNLEVKTFPTVPVIRSEVCVGDRYFSVLSNVRLVDTSRILSLAVAVE